MDNQPTVVAIPADIAAELARLARNGDVERYVLDLVCSHISARRRAREARAIVCTSALPGRARI